MLYTVRQYLPFFESFFTFSSVYRVRDVVWEQKFHNKVPDLYVKVKVDDIKGSARQTRAIKRSISPHWDEILTL